MLVQRRQRGDTIAEEGEYTPPEQEEKGKTVPWEEPAMQSGDAWRLISSYSNHLLKSK